MPGSLACGVGARFNKRQTRGQSGGLSRFMSYLHRFKRDGKLHRPMHRSANSAEIREIHSRRGKNYRPLRRNVHCRHLRRYYGDATRRPIVQAQTDQISAECGARAASGTNKIKPLCSLLAGAGPCSPPKFLKKKSAPVNLARGRFDWAQAATAPGLRSCSRAQSAIGTRTPRDCSGPHRPSAIARRCCLARRGYRGSRRG